MPAWLLPMARGWVLAGKFSPPSLQVKAVPDVQDPQYFINEACVFSPEDSILPLCLWTRFTLHPKSLPMIHLLGVPCGSVRGQTVFQDWATHVAGVSRVGGGLSLGSSHLQPAHRNPLLRRCSHTLHSGPATRPGPPPGLLALTGAGSASSGTPGCPPAPAG